MRSPKKREALISSRSRLGKTPLSKIQTFGLLLCLKAPRIRPGDASLTCSASALITVNACIDVFKTDYKWLFRSILGLHISTLQVQVQVQDDMLFSCSKFHLSFTSLNPHTPQHFRGLLEKNTKVSKIPKLLNMPESASGFFQRQASGLRNES